ncbi:radical SAM protein [Undibacterium sp. TJN25]|uniref:radical SAM protein n=1 Tax=Undibacterium sp. TJN25 TaxID=3413056 RepID=UPI003BF28B74
MNVQVEVTTRCNFGCFYCAGRDMPQKDMSLDQCKSIIDRHVERYGVPVEISLQGEGEPTLNHSFFDMAAYAKDVGALPYTITNGTYKYPEHFAASFSKLGVSVDTLDPHEANQIGRYNLPRVIEFINAAKFSVTVIIHSVALSPSIQKVADWCAREGFTHIVQPLQTKPDYQYRYPQMVVMHRKPSRFKCAYLTRDLMRYYTIGGTELPCFSIKDTKTFISISDLRAQFLARQEPSTCIGCRYLG